MRPNLKFKKGDFITQISYPNVFAIFGGTPFEPIEDGGETDYSLICYYNPSHFTQNSDGKWDSEAIFDYDLNGESTCEYTINESDMDFWRLCTEEEKRSALKILAEKKHIAWDDIRHNLRRMTPNERLYDGATKPLSTSRINPYYRSNRIEIQKITLEVKSDWEQKEPITVMTAERRNLILEQCEKLKYSFSSYSSNIINVNQSTAHYHYPSSMMAEDGLPIMYGDYDEEYDY